MDNETLKELAVAVLENESKAIANLVTRINGSYFLACEIMLNCQGRIVVMGMGKSGHIGGKIAATLASTGTPAFFVHPGEASHGDIGMLTHRDVLLALSYSGETDELTMLLPLLKRLGVPMIALTGNKHSTIALQADAHIDVSVTREACPLGLAPTTSSTAALAMGDALAVSLLESRGFTADDFALSHPGGQLGRRLLLHVNDIMNTGDAVPVVSTTVTLGEALLEMTNKRLGMTAVIDSEGKAVGIFTDGDLRRVLDHGPVDIHVMTIGDVMTRCYKAVSSDMLAVEAIRMMEQYKINSFLVVDEGNRLVGALNTHNLLRARVL